jgi:homoserine kinase
VPDRQLATSEMRRVLPASVPMEDAVFNAARVGLAVVAFATGELSWLAAATEDRLHQPYRSAVFPALPVLIAAARRAGALGACLSGAGSTVIAFCRPEDAPRIGRALLDAAGSVAEAGTVKTVGLRGTGATVTSA